MRPMGERGCRLLRRERETPFLRILEEKEKIIKAGNEHSTSLGYYSLVVMSSRQWW